MSRTLLRNHLIAWGTYITQMLEQQKQEPNLEIIYEQDELITQQLRHSYQQQSVNVKAQ
jgi:hypothetical protein